MKKAILLILVLAVITTITITAITTTRHNEVEASTTQDIAITDTPTYCQEGSWVIDDWTYIGKRCVNYQPTPSPTPSPIPKAELSWEEVAKPSCWKFDSKGWYEIQCPEPTPSPTPMPTPFYYGNVCPIPMQSFQDELCNTTLYIYDYFGYKVFLTQGNCGMSMQVVPGK